MLDLPVPAIAAVDGFALGGGLEIALSCDLVVAGESAVVGCPRVSVGVIPGGGGTQLLTRRVGWSRAADLIFTARRLAAAEALGSAASTGWCRRARPATAALELAATIAANSPVGLRNAKRAMRRGARRRLAAGLEVEDACWAATAFSGGPGRGRRRRSPRNAVPAWPGR